jgi:two-component system, sensor histidine kinase PdtaS
MEKLLAWLPERPQPLIVRYGTTAINVAICFAVLLLVQLQSGVDSFFLMYPAVFLGALLFDRGSGFFAALLSTVLIVIFLPREGGVIIPPSYWSPVTLFLLIGLALAALSEALRKGWERAIEAERAKDLLYRELRHRTKNDFAMAVSVLNLQARTQIKPEIRQALADAASRLHVLSKAHEQLEPTDERSAVRMCDYLQALCRSLTESMGPEKADVSVESPTRSSTLSCRNEKAPLQSLCGLGSQLVELLVRQLEGNLERTEAMPGCRVQIEFPERA